MVCETQETWTRQGCCVGKWHRSRFFCVRYGHLLGEDNEKGAAASPGCRRRHSCNIRGSKVGRSILQGVYFVEVEIRVHTAVACHQVSRRQNKQLSKLGCIQSYQSY